MHELAVAQDLSRPGDAHRRPVARVEEDERALGVLLQIAAFLRLDRGREPDLLAAHLLTHAHRACVKVSVLRATRRERRGAVTCEQRGVSTRVVRHGASTRRSLSSARGAARAPDGGSGARVGADTPAAMDVRREWSPPSVGDVRFPVADPALLDLVLETHPLPTLVVDAQLRIAHANGAARMLLNPARAAAGGAALRDLQSAAAAGGCAGGGRCGHCLVRRVVKSALGGVAARARAFLAVDGPGTARAAHLLAAAVPLERAEGREALLVVEDLAEALPLPAILPVCAGCAKIRDAASTWLDLGAYLGARLGVEVSHGLCDACLRRLYPDGEDA